MACKTPVEAVHANAKASIRLCHLIIRQARNRIDRATMKGANWGDGQDMITLREALTKLAALPYLAETRDEAAAEGAALLEAGVAGL